MKSSSILGCLWIATMVVACSDAASEGSPGVRVRDRGTSSKGPDGGRGGASDDTTLGEPAGAGAPRDGGVVRPDAGGGGGDGGFLMGPNVVIAPVAGANTFDLGAASPTFAGAKLTFEAVLTPAAGASKGSVVVRSVVVDNAATGGMRMVRPVWIVEDAQQKALAVASQTDVDLSVPTKRKSPYPTLTFTIDAWAPGAKLRLAFGGLVATQATAITGLPVTTYVECKSPTSFTPGVSRHWGVQACRDCHGGLFAYDFFGKDDATACGLNKKLLGAGGPNLLRPTVAAHAGGLMAESAAYQQALAAWRTAEQ